MPLASTWMDPVIGLDVHIVLVPPLAVPTPLPMPFVGMVFDPVGMVVGAAIGCAMGTGTGIVLVNSMPATNCGTNVTNMMTCPHLPLIALKGSTILGTSLLSRAIQRTRGA